MIAAMTDRISKIQEEILVVTQQITLFDKNLETAKNKLQQLQGHMTECVHWKNHYESELQTKEHVDG